MITAPGKVQKKDLWNNSVKKQTFSGDAPLPGKLGRALQKTEYTMLGKAPIFEGSFVQVTKKGEYIGIHNHPNTVTVGILATNPTLLLPNLMIIAQENRGTVAKGPKAKDLEITRFVPLELVEFFLDNLNERRLKIQMKTGQKYYLQLYAPGRDENFLFDQWLRLLYLMHVTRGRIRKPASESGHPMLQKSSSMLGLTKKPWLPAIMEQGSTGHLKEQLCQVHSSRETQSSIESDIASKHSLLKSDMAAFSSVSPFGISGSKNKSGGRASKRQPLCTDSKVAKRSKAKKLVASQAGSPIFYRPELRKQTIPKQTSPCSVGVRSLEFATMPQGTGLSQPRAMSLPVGPSKVPQQIKAVESCPTKNVRKYSVTKPEEILPVPMTSSKAKYVPIKLQKSKKSEALARSPKTRGGKATVKSQETSPVPQKSPKPPTQDRRGGASQTSSVKPNKPLSRPISETIPSASPAPIRNISVGVGPSKTHTISVAVGPSEVAIVPTAAAPSRPTSQGTRVASETRRTAVAPSKRQSGNRNSSKPSRPKVSSTPSPKQGRSSSSSPTQKENMVALRRTEESIAVGPSTVDNVFKSRAPSQASGPDKSQDKPHGRKVKNKESSRPSSATRKHKPSRSKETDSKSKLKAVMSAAKQKSSVTFLTIYSALSSSFDRAKHSISGDNAKTLSHNPSKRVTISDEAVPSGKRVLQEEEGGDSAKDKPSASSRTEANSPAAAMNLPVGKGASYKKAASSTKPLSQIATGEPTMAAMASHQQGKVRSPGQTDQHSTVTF